MHGMFNSHLKIRILVRNQGDAENQFRRAGLSIGLMLQRWVPAGILKYGEDVRRGINADNGRKDFLEIASKVVLVCILAALFWPNASASMPANALVALKQAGLSDKVIQAVAREKVIETAAFTVEELIQLKKAGMTDETLEVLVTERSFMKQSQPIVYGRSLKPLRLSSVQALLELKQSGVSDDVIYAIVVASSGRNGEEYDRAWDMLNRMGFEIKVQH